MKRKINNRAIIHDIQGIKENRTDDKLYIYRILERQIKNINQNKNQYPLLEYLIICNNIKVDNIDLKNIYCKIYELLFKLDCKLEIYKIYLEWLEKNNLNILIDILHFKNEDIYYIFGETPEISHYILTILIKYNLSEIITQTYDTEIGNITLFQLICRNYISTE